MFAVKFFTKGYRYGNCPRVRAKAKTDDARAKWLQDRLYHFFKLHSIGKRQTRRFTVAVSKHGGQLPIEIDLPPEELPAEYQRITVEPDKTRIREALGEQPLPWARFGERGEGLRIR